MCRNFYLLSSIAYFEGIGNTDNGWLEYDAQVQ
jgi:hypothetical protein